MYKRVLWLVVGLMLLVALPACGGGAKSETIKIALLSPLSGDVATFGQSINNGAMLAIEDKNASGGVLGRQIEVVTEDSQCSPEAAVSAANKVIDQDGVKFIIGEVCSSASIPVSEVAMAKGVFQITGPSTNPNVTVDEAGKTKSLIFRACFIDPFQGTVAAKFAVENLGAKTAAVLLDQGNDYVRGLSEYFRDSFEANGGEVVVWESYTGEDQDFSAILTKVKDASPDILYIPDYYSTVSLIAAQAREKGVTAVMMGGDGWDSSDLDRAAVDGGYFTNHYSAEDPRPEVQDFVKKYQEKYGTAPDAFATLGYDAATIMLMAIEKAGTDDPAAVAKAAESGEFPVVTGNISYDEFHNPVKSAVILQVKDGNISYINTIAP